MKNNIIFKIKKRNVKKYPYKIVFSNNKKVIVPSQHDFTDNSFIRNHGCIIAAFYMGMCFTGEKMSMKSCLKYLKDNFSKGKHVNYNLRQVCDAINKLSTGNPAKFYKKISKSQMKDELKSGHMILYTEKKPTHTSVILWNGQKFKRFSDGKYKSITISWEIRNRCTDDWYSGCVSIQK